MRSLGQPFAPVETIEILSPGALNRIDFDRIPNGNGSTAAEQANRKMTARRYATLKGREGFPEIRYVRRRRVLGYG